MREPKSDTEAALSFPSLARIKEDRWRDFGREGVMVWMCRHVLHSNPAIGTKRSSIYHNVVPESI